MRHALFEDDKVKLEERVRAFAEKEKDRAVKDEEKEQAAAYPSVNGGIFDWDDLHEQRPDVNAVFEINGVEKAAPPAKVKVTIDSAAADSVCPADWAEQFPVIKVPTRSFVTATGDDIAHAGEKRVASKELSQEAKKGRVEEEHATKRGASKQAVCW